MDDDLKAAIVLKLIETSHEISNERKSDATTGTKA